MVNFIEVFDTEHAYTGEKEVKTVEGGKEVKTIEYNCKRSINIDSINSFSEHFDKDGTEPNTEVCDLVVNGEKITVKGSYKKIKGLIESKQRKRPYKKPLTSQNTSDSE